jgi:signal transduction histidine kinase
MRSQRLRLAGLLATLRARRAAAGSPRHPAGGGLRPLAGGGGPGPGDEDDSALSALAAAAGAAIEDTGLRREADRCERWLAASAEITRRLLAGAPCDEVITLIAERAREVTGSELAVVAVPMAGTGSLVVELAVGRGAERQRGLVVPADEGLIGAAFSGSVPATSAEVAHDGRLRAAPQHLAGPGPAVAVPIDTGTVVRGVLELVRGTADPVFTPEETSTLLGFTRQAAMAMLLAERCPDTAEIALLRDHDRIARELRDLVIQRLFATGMTLQSAGSLMGPCEASEQVRRAVDELDQTIRVIRSTIFDLGTRRT